MRCGRARATASRESKTIDENDQRASIDDIRRSAAAILQQMTKVKTSPRFMGASEPSSAPATAFSTSTSTARESPKPMVTMRSMTAEKTRREIEEHEGDGDDDGLDGEDLFLSDEDRETLLEACNIAGIPTDSPDLGSGGNAGVHESLRRALALPRAVGGNGFSASESESFLRRVATDRAALSSLVRTGSEASVAGDPDVADAERELEDAEDEANAADERGDDGDLLALLLLAKRAKEEALRRAKEEMERKKALELAARVALQRMGVCSAGFSWARQGGGWRCGGGMHFISDGAVAAEMARR